MNISRQEQGGRGVVTACGLTGALKRLTALCGIFACALLVSGCATTGVDVLWSNPDFATRKIEGKVLVVGLSWDQAIRRAYEDEFALRLGERGIGALKSYEMAQGTFDADGPRPMLEAARRVGATAILSSAVIGHDHLARGVVFDEPTARWAGTYEGWYGHYWPYASRRTEVKITERYLVSTTLVDVATGKIRWTVRTHTDATSNVERDIKGFVGVMLGALSKSGLL